MRSDFIGKSFVFVPHGSAKIVRSICALFV
jgi:hypothetical protein